MLVAELRGKAGKISRDEDMLTSNVFGTLKNIDRLRGLYALLQLAGIDVTPNEAMQATFSFWPKFHGGTEPDVVINTPRHVIVVEAKYMAALGADATQLPREFKYGTDLAGAGKEFYLLAITADLARPEALDQFRGQLTQEEAQRVVWVNWQSVARIVGAMLESGEVDDVSRRWAKDLWDLMDRKNLRGFRGFFTEGRYVMSILQAVETLSELTKDAVGVVETIKPELKKAGVVPLSGRENQIFRDGCSRALDNVGDWVSTYYALPLVDMRWHKTDLGDAFLFLKIWFASEHPEIWVGCSLVGKQSHALSRRMDNVDMNFLCRVMSPEYLDSEPPFLESMPAGDHDTRAWWHDGEEYVLVYRDFDLAHFDQESRLTELVDEVARFRDLVPELASWLMNNAEALPGQESAAA